jgi:hypothetical protein
MGWLRGTNLKAHLPQSSIIARSQASKGESNNITDIARRRRNFRLFPMEKEVNKAVISTAVPQFPIETDESCDARVDG